MTTWEIVVFVIGSFILGFAVGAWWRDSEQEISETEQSLNKKIMEGLKLALDKARSLAEEEQAQFKTEVGLAEDIKKIKYAIECSIEKMIGESAYVNPEAKGHYEGCMETYKGILESVKEILSRHPSNPVEQESNDCGFTLATCPYERSSGITISAEELAEFKAWKASKAREYLNGLKDKEDGK